MAKRNITTSSPKITALTIDKNEFKNILKERIQIGEELYNQEIKNNVQFRDLKSNFEIWTDYNFEFLKQSFNSPDNEYVDSYRNSGYNFFGQMGEVYNDVVQSQQNLIEYKLKNLRGLFAKADLFKSEVNSDDISNQAKISMPLDKNEVFIVHGHDELAKTKTARFIERLGLKPIILHEQSNSGKTIIEKIEEYTNVGFGIVLYTPCDVGYKKGNESNLQSRARQNVVFEHGYLIGKIGRNNVCALVKDEIEVPNDISGVVYIKMDDDESWHIKLAKELRSSGYEIDMNKL